ncbi:MAG TPA: sugar transferase [Terriglobales bacterium]|nr:sugar transferase [Terriglobales bacterium]
MNTRRLELWILLADLAWIAGAFLISDLLRFGFTWTPDERVSIDALMPFALATAIIWIGLSFFMQMDGFRGGWKFSTVFSHVLFGTCCTTAVLLTFGYLARSYVSRLALAYFLLLLFGGCLGIRVAARAMLRRWHEGGNVWRVVILGGGRVAQEVATKIEQHPEMLSKVVGLLFPDEPVEEIILPTATNIFGALPQASHLSTLEIANLLHQARVDEVIVAMSQTPTPEVRTLLSRVRDMGIATTIVPQSYELYASRPRLITLDGLPLVQLRDPGLRRRYVILKRLLDLAVTLLLFIPAALVLLPVAAVLVLSKRRALRLETRCGQFGAPFGMLRLNIDRPVRSNSRFEAFLDHLSITELPQLWNVLRGQMSLVGPRPDPIASLSRYSEWQQRRLRVKPGMTGLAQVHGLRESSSAERKTRFDLQYVVDPYLLRDVSLLLQTIWTLLMRVFRARARGTYNVEWNGKTGLISNAHRTQPGAD